MGYWEAPSVQDRTVPYYHEIPTERRHFCGRSCYVRPVVEMPDTTAARTQTGNDWMMWAPTWVIPICDERQRNELSLTLAILLIGGSLLPGGREMDAGTVRLIEKRRVATRDAPFPS